MNTISSQYGYMKTQSSLLSTNYSVKPVYQGLVKLIDNPVFYKGSAHGFRQPSTRIRLRVSQLNYPSQETIHALFLKHFNSTYFLTRSSDSIATLFATGLCIMQYALGFPVFEYPHVLHDANTTNQFQLFVPIYEGYFLPYLIGVMLKFFEWAEGRRSEETFLEQMDALMHLLKPYAPKGSNSCRFLQAAHEEHIPWIFVEHNIFQLGYGKKSLWLDSTFTDKTSVLSSGLARDKWSTAIVLQKAGLPVPKHYLVSNEEEAVHSAKKLGYPVVVKPVNADQGRGVLGHLQHEHAVKKAFHGARQFSEKVLVEQHLHGKDYRLQVLNGELIWAIERIPAHIIGNGQDSVNTLLEQNKHIITDVLCEFITEQGYALDSIPEPNQRILISRIANISSGGTPVGVYDKVHPDNKLLAETAATLLRLDIAGIDMIMQDIQKSYREQPSAIIEVNAQPQLGSITAPRIYNDILLKLMPERGRIPIIGVFSKDWVDAIKQALLGSYQTIGLVDGKKAFINGALITIADSWFTAGRSLLLNKTVDVIVCLMDIEDDCSFPFDTLDYLFVENIMDAEYIKTALSMCRGAIITTAEGSIIGVRGSNLSSVDPLQSLPKHQQLAFVLGLYSP